MSVVALPLLTFWLDHVKECFKCVLFLLSWLLFVLLVLFWFALVLLVFLPFFKIGGF